MTKTIKGDLILTEDTTFYENLKVEGDIKGYFKLKVVGNIDCWNIDCRNIDCKNIDCRNIVCLNIDCKNIVCLNIDCKNIDCKNIVCLNIDCWNIVCWNIDCWNIVCWNIDCWNIVCCDKIKIKEGCKVKCKFLLKDRFSTSVKEWKV